MKYDISIEPGQLRAVAEWASLEYDKAPVEMVVDEVGALFVEQGDCLARYDEGRGELRGTDAVPTLSEANTANIPSPENRRPERFWTQPASYNADAHNLDGWTAVVDAEAGAAVAYFADAYEARMYAEQADSESEAMVE